MGRLAFYQTAENDTFYRFRWHHPIITQLIMNGNKSRGQKHKNGGFSNWYHQFMRETPMMIAHFCVKKTFLSHLYENVANHDFDRFRPRKLFVKISSICYQKRKWNIKHKRFIEQSISYHIGWSTLRSKVLKIAFFSYFTMHIQ